jgi:nicotinate-nucleotide adenylyltransferase
MIGILGGTFDPIHFGHLRPALEVLEALALSEVRFIPLKVAVHRGQPAASVAQRLAMVRAAVGDQQGFVVDERELIRSDRSYTYDTLLSLRGELGTAPICLLMGADAFNSFHTWYRPADILELAHLVVMQRPGSGEPEEAQLKQWLAARRANAASELHCRPAGRIFFQTVTQFDIAATAIRDLVAQGANARYLLPDPVLEIIERERLYERTAIA